MAKYNKAQLWSMFTHDFRKKYSCSCKYTLVSRYYLRPYLFVVPTGYDDRYDIYKCSLRDMYNISLIGFEGNFSPKAKAYTFECHILGSHSWDAAQSIIDNNIFDNMERLVYCPEEFVKEVELIPSIK